MKKLFGVVITIIVLVSMIVLSDKDDYTIRSVSYNGDNLRISIDGVSSDTLPTSGNYYLVDYDCSSVNTKLSWDKDNYELDVTNGGKEGSYSCYLNFSSKMPLSEVEVGSYVAYIGNNGCEGDYCSGVNANSSATSNGYCNGSTYEFIESGWRIAYVDDEGSTHLVSGGAPECVATYIDSKNTTTSYTSFNSSYKYGSTYSFNTETGEFTLSGNIGTFTWNSSTSSNILTNYKYTCRDTDGVCTQLYELSSSYSSTQAYYYYHYNYDKANGAPHHIENLNNTALKYCNDSYAKGGVCNNETARSINGSDFEKMTGGSALSSCSTSSRSCGIWNSLIDNGGYYWFATPYGSASSYNVFLWVPSVRSVNHSYSDYVGGVRPVLSLESSVIVTGGKGTVDAPYTIGNNAFILDDGNKYVSNKSNVGLRMLSVGDASSMCISVNTSGCDNYIDYADSYTMDWSSYEDGDYTVYAYYKNSDGEVIASMSRSIILDKTAPSNNSVSIGDESGLDRTLTISSDGAAYMCISNTSSNVNDCTDWVDYVDSYDWRLTGGEGEKTVYVFFKDDAGNIGSVASDTITYTIPCLGVNEVYNVSYTGARSSSDDVEFRFCAGTYRMQVWGAQGGNSGGNGGYSTGDITLTGTETLYFYVGGAGGKGSSAGFNGGGTTGSNGGAGGGATDVRINSDSLYARVIVAGGGGGKGQDSCAAGAVGGGTSGGGGASQGSCGTQGGAGTQTAGGAVGKYSSTNGLSAGTFGIGGNASDGSYDGGAGGGGWYGGGAGASAGWSNGGGGGSGFVLTSSSTLPSGYLLGSTYYLANASTIIGSSSMPSTTGGTETGHSGNGYIKITRLS